MREADRFIRKIRERTAAIEYALKVLERDADRENKTGDLKEIVDHVDEAKTIIDGWSWIP